MTISPTASAWGVDVVEECRPLAERFEAAGFRLYLVGGIVRDLLGGEAPAAPDFDFTTDAVPSEIKAVVSPLVDAVWTQGERFGTIAARRGGRLIEITTHRSEFYDPESRKPRVRFTNDIAADLSRRDFTINAMALELTGDDAVLIDPFGGLDDLRAGILRTPLGPEVSFSDDPLRMLRAARFLARFDASPEPTLLEAAHALRTRLDVVSVERIRDEFDRLLGVPMSRPGLGFLLATGLAEQFLPELGELAADAIDRLDRRDRLDPARSADNAVAGSALVARLAIVFAAFGADADAEGGANVGSSVAVRAAHQRMIELKYPAAVRRRVERILGVLDRALELTGHERDSWSAPDLRRFALAAKWGVDDSVDIAVAVASAVLSSPESVADSSVDADAAPHSGTDLAVRLADLHRAVRALDADEGVANLGAGLDGAEVVAHLAIPPGPEVGDALAHLLEVRITEGVLPREELLERLDEWWRSRGQ